MAYGLAYTGVTLLPYAVLGSVLVASGAVAKALSRKKS